ncbi:hypothetical protein QOT17_003445 [Balamuthia mandrillaris]
MLRSLPLCCLALSLCFLLVAVDGAAAVKPQDALVADLSGVPSLSSANLPPALIGAAGNYCDICHAALEFLYQKGCTASCSLLEPPLNYVCTFIESTIGLCKKILHWLSNGVGFKKACNLLGFCGNTTCLCGECTEYEWDARCLSVPNHCPDDSRAPLMLPPPQRYRAELTQPNPPFQGAIRLAARSDDVWCVNGVCEEATTGCCLTCF